MGTFKQATLRRKLDNNTRESTFTFHFRLQNVILLAASCYRNKLRDLPRIFAEIISACGKILLEGLPVT